MRGGARAPPRAWVQWVTCREISAKGPQGPQGPHTCHTLLCFQEERRNTCPPVPGGTPSLKNCRRYTIMASPEVSGARLGGPDL